MCRVLFGPSALQLVFAIFQTLIQTIFSVTVGDICVWYVTRNQIIIGKMYVIISPKMAVRHRFLGISICLKTSTSIHSIFAICYYD